jgi:hypothetical protein
MNGGGSIATRLLIILQHNQQCYNNAEPPELGHIPATPFENKGDYDVPDN